MVLRYISCTPEQILDAVEAVMACVPKPWTQNMVDDAVTVVLDVADQWSNSDRHEVMSEDLEFRFYEERLGLERNDIYAREVVAE